MSILDPQDNTIPPLPGQDQLPPNEVEGPINTGGPDPVPEPAQEPNNIWDPIGTQPENMDFNTIPGQIGGTPDVEYYGGTDQARETGGANSDFTRIGPNGEVIVGNVDPVTREVQDEELVQNQLSGILNSDSKLMQDARRQGLEMSNAMGGLGGTAGVGAAMQAAMRTALPIAESDANAFRQAASENLQSLNQFALMNAQRATQMELGQLDSRTALENSRITTSASLAAEQLSSATQRDLAMLDSETQMRAQEMGGQIQQRLADDAFRYNALLADQKGMIDLALAGVGGEYTLANTGLGGQYGLLDTEMRADIEKERNALQREASYNSLVTGAYDNYMNRLANLNGIEMDDAARRSAIQAIEEQYTGMVNLINSLYPEVEPIVMGG